MLKDARKTAPEGRLISNVFRSFLAARFYSVRYQVKARPGRLLRGAGGEFEALRIGYINLSWLMPGILKSQRHIICNQIKAPLGASLI